MTRIVTTALVLIFFLVSSSLAQTQTGTTITLTSIAPDTSGQHLNPLYLKRGEQLVILPQSVRYHKAVRNIQDQLVQNGWRQSTDMYGPRVLCNIQPFLPDLGLNELTIHAECTGLKIRYNYRISSATGISTDGSQIDPQRMPSVSQMIDRLTGSITAIERALQGSQ